MKPIFFLFSISLILAACAPQATLALPTDTPPPPTLTPTDVPPSPTADFEFDKIAQQLYEVGLSQEIINKSNNARLDNNGNLEIKDNDGYITTIQKSDLAKRLEIGHSNTLQIKDNGDGKKVEFAFDTVTNEFLVRGEYINEDKLDIEKYIRITSINDLPEFFRREKLFVAKFPPNTHTFEPGSVPLDYHRRDMGGVGYDYPFGKPKGGEVNGITMFNFWLLEANEEEGRKFDMICATTVVPNVDLTPGMLHVTVPGGGDYIEVTNGNKHFTTLDLLANNTATNMFLMPLFHVQWFGDPKALYQAYKAYLRINDIPIPKDYDAIFPTFKELIVKWLETGIVSEELSNTILPTMAKYVR